MPVGSTPVWVSTIYVMEVKLPESLANLDAFQSSDPCLSLTLLFILLCSPPHACASSYGQAYPIILHPFTLYLTADYFGQDSAKGWGSDVSGGGGCCFYGAIAMNASKLKCTSWNAAVYFAFANASPITRSPTRWAAKLVHMNACKWNTLT